MDELFDKVSGDIRTAMLARDKVALEALRGMKKEFLDAKTAKGGDGHMSDEVGIKIIQKMIKQRKESAQIYTEKIVPIWLKSNWPKRLLSNVTYLYK